ncbi:hypothetical protein I7X30_00965 [Capnocytophaga sp. 051621]|uniref:Uncharacterized protein n=1 Tax=Capnocytophaga periodontitidis TaxID=2795027 RepID=A0ABS0SJM3_9FLAO|nr:hypothetical protein [Capnocytophaga periodontitidis]MBI1645632.1 hypothetical protein [Capnocytophaga periodontitidis]
MKTFYLYTLLLLSLGCKAQEFDLRGMKRFDEKVFKDWEKDNLYVQMYDWDRFLKKGDERVRIIKTDSFIQVEFSNIANPYKNKYKYDIRTKRLILQSYFFYNCQIGIWKDWSKTGKLIKEVDYDKPYKLSVKDIITLVNQKFNIDLLDMNLLLNVERSNRSVPIYNIISITKPNTRGQEIRYITISADNGEILFDKMLSSEKDFNDIYRLEDKEK